MLGLSWLANKANTSKLPAQPLAGRVVTGTGGRSCDGTNACPTIRAARAYAHAHILSRLQPKMLTGDRSFGHVKVSVGPIILVSV